MQIENLAGAMAGGHLRRQSRTTVRAGLGIMIGNRVGFGDLAQRCSPWWPFCPHRLAARLLAQAPGAPPDLLPRRRLAQSIAGRRLAAVGAVQAEPALEFVEPCRQRQHQIDQFVFRQEGSRASRFIGFLNRRDHPLLVDQTLRHSVHHNLAQNLPVRRSAKHRAASRLIGYVGELQYIQFFSTIAVQLN